MAVATSNKIRLAEVPPAACASCFAQNPDREHVDFGAYYDGPVLDGSKGIQIDDLVICDQCLGEAASLIGLTSNEALEKRLANAAHLLGQAQAKNEAQAAHIADLKKALASKRKIQDAE